MSKISIIIPLYNDYKSIDFLLTMIHNQTMTPDEVIIVDSSEIKKNIVDVGKKFKFNIIHKKIKPSYPGKSRNIGINYSKNEINALLDCRTFPHIDWLKGMYLHLTKSDSSIVLGKRNSLSENPFKNLLKISTYGNKDYTSISGSIFFKKHLLKKNILFKEEIRAGEDLLWIKEIINSNLKISFLKKSNHVYYGFPDTIKKLTIKWFKYSISNAFIPIMIFQKTLYFFSFLIILFYIILINNFSDHNNITDINKFFKISIFLVFLIHLLYRSVYRPYRQNLKLSEIFPIQWLKIYFLTLYLDIIKIPGGILGFFNLLLKNYRN